MGSRARYTRTCGMPSMLEVEVHAPAHNGPKART